MNGTPVFTDRKPLRLLEANPCHPSLRLHALKGSLNRTTLELLIEGRRLIPVTIGDHATAYRC